MCVGDCEKQNPRAYVTLLYRWWVIVARCGSGSGCGGSGTMVVIVPVVHDVVQNVPWSSGVV